jgi:two-component SAPR family response regulator
MQAMSTDLEGRRVLVAEDQYLIAAELCRHLTRLGADVVGPVASVNEVLDLLDTVRVDVAVLDVNLDGEMVYAAAEELEHRNIPFAFVTGYGQAAIRSDFAHSPHVQKPCELQTLADVLIRLVDQKQKNLS